MMTVSLRAAHPSRPRISLAAVRSWLLLTLLAVCGGFASAQGLSPGGPVVFGPVQIGNTSGTTTLTFSAPPAGITIQSVTAVTGGALNKDFAVVSNTCNGYLHSPSTCVIELSFSPTQLGIRLGALNIRDSNGNITNTVYLSGVGVGPQFVFAPTAAVITSSSSALSPANFKPGASVVDGDDNLYFTDVTNGRILERSALGVYSQIATLPVSNISGIAMDGTGTLYVSVGSSVYYFMPGSTPQILPLPASITPGTTAGLAIDLAQDLYIADNTKNVIYQVTLGGTTGTTLAITGPGVPLSGPAGLAVDASNYLYVADSGHDRIVEVPLGSLASKVVTLTSLTLTDPTGVSVDTAGTIYIANTGGSNVIESTVTGAQFILTETPDPFTLVTPANILIQPNGDLVISDTTEGLVDVARSAPAVNFPTPTEVGTLDATDDPEALTVQSSGNISADLAVSPTTTNPSISTTAFILTSTGSCPILAAGAPVTAADAFSPGEVCTYNINFKPAIVGLNSANLILSTTAAGGALTASTTVPLTGIGLSTAALFKLVAIPSTINKGGTVQLILTAYNADGTTVATDFVGTVTFTTTDSTGLFLFGTSPNTNTTTYTFTAADNGVLNVTPGLQLNQYGVFTATATANPATLIPSANPVAVSNLIYVIEPATLTLTSSINPSLVNQSTTFTLNVGTTGGLTPTGTVTFFSNGVQIGSPVTLSPGGTASINDSFPAAGNYAITATFTPSNSTQGGTASLTQVVGLPTAIVLTSSINPSLVNQSTNFTATITAIASPTGSVTFYNGATALGTVPVTVTGNTGTATLPASFAASGTYPITAVYTTTSTNPDVTSATSTILNQVVENTSTLLFTSSVNPSLVGQSTTLTADLTALGTPTGTVSFYDGATLLGTVNLTGGVASLSVSFATAGAHPLKAVYSGDTLTQPATATLTQNVLNVASAFTLTSSVNPSQVGQSTTLKATLTALGTPTGTVSFYDGTTLLGTVSLTGGTASLTVSFSTPGGHPLKAVYSGDTLTAGATATLLQTVLFPSGLTLTSSVNPSLVGQSTTLTAFLSATGTPTGTVKFYDGATLIGTATLAGSSANVSVSFATAGTHTLTAVYSGDPNNQAATSAPLAQIVLNVVSSFTLTSSVNPSQIGQSTTLTANLAALGTPTGTVKFYDGTTLLGTVNLTADSSSLTVSFSTPGAHNLKAVYSGDTNTGTATATLIQTVLNTSGLVLSSSINPSLVGQSTTLTATLTASGTPTGTVKFYDGATLIGTANLAGTTASLSVSFSTAGTHTLTAVYSGDANTQGVTSGPLAQVVLNVAALTLTSSVNPSQPNQSTTFTATLAALGTPTGTIKFYNGATLIGTQTLSGNTASVSISFPNPGTYALKAVYSGDTLTGPATATLSQVVLNFSTINLTSSVNPSMVGQSTTLTASLTASGTPTGTMKFYDGTTLIGTANLNGTAASISVSFATAGTHPLTAVYSGDVNTSPGSSAVLSQVVLNVTSLTLTSSVNPSQPNQSTTLTASISTLGTPTGTVSFYDGTTLLGTVTLSGTTASLSVSFSAPGTHPLKAVYSGDTNTSPGTSAILDQIVLYPTTITLTTSVNPVLVNANTTLTSTVKSAGTPTGTVTFYAGTTKLGTATITGGVASLVVSFPTAGVYALTAVYSGDADNQTATSAPVSQTVLNIATVALTSSINPVFLDNPTILTALVTSTGVTPTGTVSFFDGGTPLGTVALVSGSASLSATFVYAGPHTITAVYSGDTVTESANAPALTQTVADFSLTVASGSSSSGTTIAGGTAKYALVLTPLTTTTLPGAVSITVTGLPTTATFTLTPSTVASGSGATPVAFTVTAAQITAAIRAQQPPAHRSSARYAPVALALLALPLAWFRRRKRFGSLLASVCLLFAITGGLTGCISDPSSGYYGQTPQTYNVTVTATSGNLARSTPLTLTVQ
jgi:sugar lactone lactonase YvrE